MENVGMWELMLVQLTGKSIDNFKLNEVAKTMTGSVKTCTEHLLMTKSLWKTTSAEKFETLQFGYAYVPKDL